MKCEDVKGRGKVRTYSGLFSMGALAIALSACGGDFKLADENGVVVSGADVKLTFTDAPKTVSKTTSDYKVTATGVTLSSVTSSDKVVTFTFAGTSDNIKVELATATAIKDNNDKDYALNITIDNKAPVVTLVALNADTDIAAVRFDEKILAADASKFKIDGVAATVAIIGGDGDAAGKVVILTFKDITKSAKIGLIEAGAVTDDVSGKANSAANQNEVNEGNINFIGNSSGALIVFGPVLADGDTTKAGVQSLTINSANTVLTVTFDEAITGKVDSSIVVKQGTATKAGGTITISGLTLTITYADTLDAAMYTVEIGIGGVTSTDGTTTFLLTTSVVDIPPSLEDDLVGLSLGSSDADYGF